MCRTDLGECCAQGCTARISCQDTGGYCNAHDPFAWSECPCEDDCVCPPAEPRPPDDEAKRLTYSIARTEKFVQQSEAEVLRLGTKALQSREQLDVMRARLVTLTSARYPSSEETPSA